MTWSLRALTAALLLTAPLAAADKIKVNAEYEGKLPAAASTLPVKGGNTYIEEVAVDLTEDREITVTVSGSGDSRVMAVAVFDGNKLVDRSFEQKFPIRTGVSDKQMVATFFANATGGKYSGKGMVLRPTEGRSVSFTAARSGTYTVVVMSNLSGKYKLTVTDPKAK